MTREPSEFILQILDQREASPLRVVYTNWRGETSTRTIYPLVVRWGKTKQHPEPQWLLECWDMDKQARRTYALQDCDFVHPQDDAVSCGFCGDPVVRDSGASHGWRHRDRGHDHDGVPPGYIHG